MAAEPESIDVNEFAARLEAAEKEAPADVQTGDLAETPEVDPEHAAEAAEVGDRGDDVGHDAGAEPGDGDVADDAGADAEPPTDAPEFWSAEDKAFWAKIPAEVRPLVKKYEEARVEFANQKAREAAAERQKAAEEVNKYKETIGQAATWWEQQGPQFVKAFGDKWSQVNWQKLSEENPAEYVRLEAAMKQERGLLEQAHARAQQDVQVRNQKQQEELQSFKVAEHSKVAKELPDYFGTPEKAAKTYDDIGKYLFSQGIPAERINTIHEAPIIKLALKAKLYDDAKAKASAVTSSGTTGNPRNPAPTRVAPGPAQKTGNRQGEAARQAVARFMENNNDMDAAAAALRALGI